MGTIKNQSIMARAHFSQPWMSITCIVVIPFTEVPEINMISRKQGRNLREGTTGVQTGDQKSWKLHMIATVDDDLSA
jgi:hypothetical protein